jgi:aspartate ammonia-lyase
MPGKFNPVIPEVMNQVCFEVIGNVVAISMAAVAGQMQLNAFEPLIGWALHKSLMHLARACHTLQVNCVEGIEANHPLLGVRLAESITLVTALNPIIGYEQASSIAKAAMASDKTIAVIAEELGVMGQAEMKLLLVPEKLTQAGALSASAAPVAVNEPATVGKAPARGSAVYAGSAARDWRCWGENSWVIMLNQASN